MFTSSQHEAQWIQFSMSEVRFARGACRTEPHVTLAAGSSNLDLLMLVIGALVSEAVEQRKSLAALYQLSKDFRCLRRSVPR